jgi:hypothetical protein
LYNHENGIRVILGVLRDLKLDSEDFSFHLEKADWENDKKTFDRIDIKAYSE